MDVKQPYDGDFSSDHTEYLLQVAISQALERHLPTTMDEHIPNHPELAHREVVATHQEDTTPASGIKRESDSPDMGDAPKPKTRRRKGDPEPDYSGKTREALKNNGRTGQACDRCKLRKLRCDPTPNSCQQCLAADQPCRSTDRVTGETFLRGEAGTLKAENELLRAQVSKLEEEAKLLREQNEGLKAQLAFHQELFQGIDGTPQ